MRASELIPFAAPRSRPLRRVLLLVATCLPAALASPAAAAWTPEAELGVPQLGEVALAADGSRVAWVVAHPDLDAAPSRWRTRIHLAGVDLAAGSGSDPGRPVTASSSSAFDPRFSPDGRHLAFRSDRTGGVEVWVLPLAGGEARRVTDAAGAVVAFRWLPDGGGLVYAAAGPPPESEADGADAPPGPRVVGADLRPTRLWRVPVPDDGVPVAACALTPPELHVAATVPLSFGHLLAGFDVSPDGREVVFTHAPSPRVDDWQESDLAVVPLDPCPPGGDARDPAARDGWNVRPLVASPAAEGAPRFTPDGRSVVYAASTVPPTMSFAARLHRVPRTGGEPRPLAATADARPEVVGFAAPDRVLVREIRGTRVALVELPLEGSPVDLEAHRVLGDVAVAAGAPVAAFVAESPSEPAEVFVTRLDRHAPRRVSALHPEAPRHPLGRTEVVRWAGQGGLAIEGLLTLPVGHRPGKRVPLLVHVHGGPTGYHLAGYRAGPGPYPLATFAARGWAVLEPNIRGSSGRGAAFRAAVEGDWGGADFEDLLRGVDHLVERGVADPSRLGIFGWSYGGYMTAWAITRTNRFRAASVGAGLVDLLSFTGTADIRDFLPVYFGAEPWDDPRLYLERSPILGAGRVETPTLVLHGEEDRRVPASQGFELHAALRERGVPVELVLYPRAGHGLGEPGHLLDAARRNLEWFERWLGEGTGETEASAAGAPASRQ